MYELVEEEEMMFSMLFAMDGNESLRRVFRKASNPDGSVDIDEETGRPLPGKSKERTDDRDAGENYWVLRDKVDKWAKERVANLLPRDEVPGEETPCSDRWKNMINDLTAKMWGVFDETGIFLALCRHGFVLLLADMIRSGELAKYPLAIVDELLDMFGKNLGIGYDIGCHFEATIKKSLLSERAKEKLLTMLVGAFHGHAHNRLCQLKFLATYVKGLGLEDLEVCEQFFSQSNALAKPVRYASRFHRQQEITTYIKHFDSFETYTNLSKFLCNNYQQALGILATEPALKQWMNHEGILSVNEFEQWLVEEKEWLMSKKNSAASQKETLEMEYVQKLVNLSVSQARFSTIRQQSNNPDSDYDPAKGAALKRAQKHAEEIRNRDQEAVIDMEEWLQITERWTTTSPGWVAAVKQLKEKKFMDALNSLELLIVERIFELTKVNRSGTAYKMRTHITKSLKARCGAVQNAIQRYNIAARALEPPAPELTWDQVVEYAFLADFDFLRVTDEDVLKKPWSRPANWLAMDSYFKIERAREEIVRLNNEIRRLVTWINDEDHFLRKRESELTDAGDTDLAVLVRRYRLERGRSDMGHMKRLWRLAKTPGFTGSILPGLSKEVQDARKAQWRQEREEKGVSEDPMDVDEEEEELAVTVDMTVGWEPPARLTDDMVDVNVGDEGEEMDEDDEGEVEEEKELSELLYDIVRVTIDGKVEDGDKGEEDEVV
ncbi:hypothetical protein MVEN_00023800 [Mycena venus]|uniref:Uncharacterized protein n=1 Tax=Mycena venus TaxID=2733690 RepID=A0A8H6Z8E1_9AGAR|nr:hypothetical protein MVEN_00023800 [Mycena venus]